MAPFFQKKIDWRTFDVKNLVWGLRWSLNDHAATHTHARAQPTRAQHRVYMYIRTRDTNTHERGAIAVVVSLIFL